MNTNHKNDKQLNHSKANKNGFKNNTPSPSMEVIHGPITEESKSTFQSHVAKVYSMNDVKQFKEIVLSDKKVNSNPFIAALLTWCIMIDI